MTGYSAKRGRAVSELMQALKDPALPFLRMALLAGVLSSIAFGILGPIVTARRIVNISGSISHSVLGGVGLALFLYHEKGWLWCRPTLGALAAALVSAAVIGAVSLHGKEREDTVIGAVWTVGMAAGVLFLSLTHAFVDPMSYLFGNILLLTRTDLLLIAGLDIVILAVIFLCYNAFVAVCFDEEYAKLRGLKTGFLYQLLLVLVALTVVLFLPIVGTVLVIAMLTLPAAIAGLFTRHLWSMMVGSVVTGAVFTVLGIGLSYVKDLPSGSTIVVLLGAAYLALVVAMRILKR
jgi:zinc transport system permease protein